MSATMSCDLLKIHYLCGNKDNYDAVFNGDVVVVICSKFITFAVTKTTVARSKDERACCDLLKIHYLCGNKDNAIDEYAVIVGVVICSKFITFAVTKTTDGSEAPKPLSL